jgi:hypothetical protein
MVIIAQHRSKITVKVLKNRSRSHKCTNPCINTEQLRLTEVLQILVYNFSPAYEGRLSCSSSDSKPETLKFQQTLTPVH